MKGLHYIDPSVPELAGASITHTGEALTIMFGANDLLSHEFKKAFTHRVAEPVHFVFRAQQKFKEEWWLHGTNHNPFGGPALQTITGTHHVIAYYDEHGRHFREDGPALIEHHYGVKYLEYWYTRDSQYHRIGGPAEIEIEYQSTSPRESEFKERTMRWYRNGKFYNDESWTKQIDWNGSEIIEPIPDGIIRTLSSTSRALFWYDSVGQKHRTDGPAELSFQQFREVEKSKKPARWQWSDWHGEWYIHGEHIPNGKIIKWAKKNGIRMWGEPCYNRSAFRTATDEVCFVTEFS